MPRQPEEGPVRRRPPAQEGRRPERQGREAGHQDLVAPLHDHPRHGRPHHRRARRAQARARVHHRVDGRPQARRVRAHPHVPVPRRPGEGARAAVPMTFGVKTNERPGTRAEVALRPHVGLQGPRGARPHPRQARSQQADEILAVRRARRRHRRSASASPRRSPTPSTTTAIDRRRALRLGLLRRRGPDAQALAPPCPRPGHPHPQAHLPHHGHRQPPARGAARASAGSRRGEAVEPRCAPQWPAGRRPRVASVSPAAGAAAAEAEAEHDHDHDHDEHDHDHDDDVDDDDVVEPEMVEVDEVDLDDVDAEDEADEAEADEASRRGRRRRGSRRGAEAEATTDTESETK